MKKIVARIIAFVMVLAFLSVDFAPALTVSAAPAETASEVAEGEENITIPEEESSEEGIVPEEESETEKSTEEISETEEPTEEASSEPESVSEEPESEDMTSEDVSEEVSDESEETASEEDAETSEEATDDTSEEESEEPANEEFTGPLVIVDSVELLDEGLAEGRNVGVAINAKNFPDAGFREFIREDYDKYPYDGVLDANELKSITVINVNDNEEIKDLTGIEYLRYMTMLDCSGIGLNRLAVNRNTKLFSLKCNNNSIELLDLSGNRNLAYLECYVNELKELDVSNNTELYKLDCRNNNLETLHLGKNLKLEHLYCSDNKLVDLDVTLCKRLESLSCDGNKLTKIDISKNSELEQFDCKNNQLKSLDVSKQKKLEFLYCNNNEISVLDVRTCANLLTLYCVGNNLEKIDLRKNTKLKTVYIANNRLSTIDVTKNALLSNLWISNNSIKEIDLSKNRYLTSLKVDWNQLEVLDISNNPQLTQVDFSENRLTCVDLSKNLQLTSVCINNTNVNSNPNYSAFRIELDDKNSFDLSTLSSDFDINKIVVGSWSDATIEGTVVRIGETALKKGYVTYKYRCSDKYVLQFTLAFTPRKLNVDLQYEYTNIWYTGKVCEPKVEVKYGEIILAENVDYTILYKNNINASTGYDYDNYPTIQIKGKGNYSFEYTKTFKIKKLDLSGDLTTQNIVVDNVEAKYTGKKIKVTPKIYSNGILIPSKEIEVIYPDTKDGAYMNPGTYTVTLKGKGTNVVGKCNLRLRISKTISKVKVVTDQKAYPYNEVAGVVYPNKVTVTDGKTVLKEGVDYTLSYSNHRQAGTATILVTGKGVYEGTKKATYKITGKKLTASMVKVLNKTLDYDDYFGRVSLLENVDYTIKAGDTLLEEGIDFVCIYPKTGPKPGSYKVMFKGIGIYEGSVSKTFQVKKVSVADAYMYIDKASYSYDGTNIKPILKVSGMLEGRDYTVVYVNNKNAASEADAKAPYLYIKGKGGYTGTTKANPVKFTIEKASLTSHVTLKVDNILYKDKNNNYVTKFTLTEKTTGKKLAKGKDYDKVKYEYKLNGKYTEISSGKCPAEATSLRITVYASENGNYSGSISTEYSFYTKQISKAKVQAIAAREYNGQQVRPLPVVTMAVKNNGKTETITLVRGRDYVLEYGANNKVGTGTVIIKGIGDYGGSKTVKFKITKKVIK